MPRPTEVMQAANRAWNDTFGKQLAKGKSYREAAKLAQKEYDKVLKKYDRNHRTYA